MRHFQRLMMKNICRCVAASIAYSHVHPGNYDTEYSSEIDEQLKSLEARCPQGDDDLIIQRNLLFKSRYDAYGDNQSLFLAKDGEKVIGIGSATNAKCVIDEHDQSEYNEAYFLDLRVDPDHRRKGIGSTITQLTHKWAKYDENVNIATFGILTTNNASNTLYQKYLMGNDAFYFIHNIYIYVLKENEDEMMPPSYITENNYNISVNRIFNEEDQRDFLCKNIPIHYILYPNKESMETLVNASPFECVYVARLSYENGDCINDEWVSISVYDQSQILQYSMNGTVIKPLILTAKMSTVVDKRTEFYIFKQLLNIIVKEYDGKVVTMASSENYQDDEVYGDLFSILHVGNEYYVNLDENDEIYTTLQNTIHNTTRKELWMDPRKC